MGSRWSAYYLSWLLGRLRAAIAWESGWSSDLTWLSLRRRHSPLLIIATGWHAIHVVLVGRWVSVVHWWLNMHRLIWCSLIVGWHASHLTTWDWISVVVNLRWRRGHSSCCAVVVAVIASLRWRTTCLIVLVLTWLLWLSIVHAVLLLHSSAVVGSSVSTSWGGTSGSCTVCTRLTLLSCIAQPDLS